MNPASALDGAAGLGSRISSAAINPDHITIRLAIKAIRSRVAVSEPLAMAIAELAGIGGSTTFSNDNQQVGSNEFASSTEEAHP